MKKILFIKAAKGRAMLLLGEKGKEVMDEFIANISTAIFCFMIKMLLLIKKK
ncbi:hypothetical protein [Oceanirhabdus seepicola]|uniref:Uncharacterized protein n=1 Tax=Oceanirhabdus seepicola TaxID=2828781 RepID=A0A9J6P3T3_9CLOT|nr:hypothetical protein [Oceanirhabdus seepicola]MCM1991359.1 hypothetical protein [Oceanirhabdus seepicola]